MMLAATDFPQAAMVACLMQGLWDFQVRSLTVQSLSHLTSTFSAF
jgi:hypothetical protein